MEQSKALMITDVIKEPRSFEIWSKKQMEFMEQEQHFELDLQDIEGMGSVYSLLTYVNAPQKAIDHALAHGARLEDVWVLRELNILHEFQFACFKRRTQTDEERFIEETLTQFLHTCHPFCVVGDYKGHSYMEMHKYETCTAIFSLKEDANVFLELIQILTSDVPFQEKEVRSKEMVEPRPIVETKPQYQWEHLL